MLEAQLTEEQGVDVKRKTGAAHAALRGCSQLDLLYTRHVAGHLEQGKKELGTTGKSCRRQERIKGEKDKSKAKKKKEVVCYKKELHGTRKSCRRQEREEKKSIKKAVDEKEE